MRVSAGTSASISGTATVKRRLTSGSAILPVADPERAVARHAGDDALARVDDAEVVEARDVDARRRRARRAPRPSRPRRRAIEQRERQRPVRAAVRRRRVAGRPCGAARRVRRSRGPRRRRARRRPRRAGRAASASPSKSNAFGRPRGSSASSAIEIFSSNDALADPAGEVARAPRGAPRPLKRVEGEVLEQLGERVRLEHGAVRARLDLGRAASCARAFSAASRRDRRRVDVRRRATRSARRSRSAPSPAASTSAVASVIRCSTREPGRRRDRELGHRRS